MKRILSAILSFVLGMSSFMTAALAEEEIIERVEISFKVGDSVLMINGEATEVETPYIVGEGTTLVPLRVITEAFGAEVTWVDETKEIYLSCPDVSIVLQIGNSEAQVNSHTETLPEAPALSPNGVTMVPLRFISETFGAEVGYDEKTAYITVVKGVSDESETMNNMPRVGDSYYGWSINTPKAMHMQGRGFTGTYTEFFDENESYLGIYVSDLDEGTTVEQRFNELRESYSGKTLIMAEKSTDANGNTIMRLKARDKEFNYGEYVIETGERVFTVLFGSKFGSAETAVIEELANSFEVGFGDASSTYDLSNVEEDGYRLFEDKDMKVSFKVPIQCDLLISESANKAEFVSDESIATIVLFSVYSKAENGSAMSMAEIDRKIQEEYYNKKHVQVSGVSSYNKAPVGDNACTFTLNTVNLPTGDVAGQSIYFEKGEYVYCFIITCPVEKSSVIDTIASSIKTEELDVNEFGIAMRDLSDMTGSFQLSMEECELTIPSVWEEIEEPSAGEGKTYANKRADARIVFSVTDVGGNIGSDYARDWANEMFDSMIGDLTGIEKNVTQTVYGGKDCYTFVGYVDNPYTGDRYYFTFVTLVDGGKAYEFLLDDNILYHGGKVMEDFESIIASLRTK